MTYFGNIKFYRYKHLKLVKSATVTLETSCMYVPKYICNEIFDMALLLAQSSETDSHHHNVAGAGAGATLTSMHNYKKYLSVWLSSWQYILV